MLHTKANSGKKGEPDAAPGWMIALLYVPLFIAAATVLALIVSMHLLYKPWLLDSRHRQYSLYIACLVTVAAFLICCCIAFFIRRKQMYGDYGYVTVHTRLVDGKKLLPLYMDVEAPPVKTTVLPAKFVAPPAQTTNNPAAG